MKPVNCNLQPQITNIEECPNKCSTICSNGFCDCSTSKCLCSPGFSGPNCTIDTCAAAGCVNGNCAAKYLGGELFVTKKECICKEGWYGDKCDTNIKPLEPSFEPICFDGSYYFVDTDIEGGNIDVIFGKAKPQDCSDACLLSQVCKAWVYSNGVCFFKGGTQRVLSFGTISGIKCSSIEGPIGSITNPPVTDAPNTMTCVNKCQGDFPHGCNPSLSLGYCSTFGGCSYSAQPANDPNWYFSFFIRYNPIT